MGLLDTIAANYARMNNEFNAQYKAKYGVDAPVGNTSERPDDKMAPQAKFTDALRKEGVSPGEAFLTGFRRTATSGPTTGFVKNMFGVGNAGVPEEARRKMDYGVHEVSPVADTLGMIAGAPVGAADYVLSTLGTFGAGGRAATTGIIGDGAAPITLREATPGLLERGLGATTNGLARLGGYLARESSPVAKGAAAVAAGLGLGTAAIANNSAPVVAPAAAPAVGLDRDAALAGTASPAHQYLAQITNPDGSPKEGYTKSQVQWAQMAAQVGDNRNAAGDGVRTLGVALPAQAFPDGEAGLAKFMGAPAATAAPAPAPASNALKLTPAVVHFADVMDAYEAQHPGNEGGVWTDAEYKEAKSVAAEVRAQQDQQRQALWVGLGKQIGITDPEVAVAFGREGGFTRALMDNTLNAQQSRTTTRMGYRDLAWQQADEDLRVAEAEANRMPAGEAKDAALAQVKMQRRQLQLLTFAPTVPTALQDLQATTDN